MKKENRFVIVGLGRIGRELLKRLPKDFDVTCVSMEEDAREILHALKREDVELIKGDATSRLVLEDARVDESDAVIITTTGERINSEIAKVLREHFSPRRVISVAFTKKEAEALEEMGVEVEDIFASSALGIRNSLEPKSKAAHGIGLGKNEILEIEVHPNSRLTNKPLGAIDPIRWRVGIIYREGNIVIPTAETVLKPGDKVVVLGDPAILSTVSEILTFNFEKFPLQYGSQMIVYVSGKEDEAFMREANYIFSSFPMEKMLVEYPEKVDIAKYDGALSAIEDRKLIRKKTFLPPIGALRDAASELGGKQGLIVISGALVDSMGSVLDIGKKRFLRELIRFAKCPVLIARGKFPYVRLAVPCVAKLDVDNVLEKAIEVSSILGGEVTSLEPTPSRYIAGEDEVQLLEEMRKTVSSLALIYKAKVQRKALRGNPVRSIVRELVDFHLLMANMGDSRRERLLATVLEPDALWRIISRSNVSAILIPSLEEFL